MKKFLLLLSFLMFFSANVLKAGTDTTGCNWLGRITYYYFWDTCQGNSGRNSLTAKVVFKNQGCLKYTWKANGNIVGTNNYINYVVTRNGTYQLCLSVYDSCTQCDTTVCYSKTISCFTTCNFKAKQPAITVNDSCTPNVGPAGLKLTASLSNWSCTRVSWTVNNVSKGGGTSTFVPISANGTYQVCAKFTDTCKKCDTTICFTRQVNCSTKCNWKKSRNPVLSVFDSCVGYRTYVYFNLSLSNYSCLKYQWKSGNTPFGFNASYSWGDFSTTDSVYTVCLKIIDTCNKCDTTICVTRTNPCYNPPPPCLWKLRKPYVSVFDSCIGNRDYVYLSATLANGSCVRYQWKSGNTQFGSGTHYSWGDFSTTDSVYTICLKLTDTCNTCDTTICITRTNPCYNRTICNWKGRTPVFGTWDSCIGPGYRNSINGNIYFWNGNSNCYKYYWYVNNKLAGTSPGMSYTVTRNGTYTMMLRVVDTCNNNCDTTFWSYQKINCFATCSWKSRNPTLSVFDSCVGNRSYVYFNLSLSNSSCLKYQWKSGNAPFGFNAPYSWGDFSTTDNVYTVCLKLTDTCYNCDTTICVTRSNPCFRLGVYDRLVPDALKIYPNPAGEYVYADWPGSPTDYECADMLGTVVMRGTIATGLNRVSAIHLNTGVYILKVFAPEGVVVRKIIIQK